MDRGVGVFVGMGGWWGCVCAPPRSSPRLLPPHQHLLSTPEGLPGEFPESRGRGCPAPPLQTGAAQADPRAPPRPLAAPLPPRLLTCAPRLAQPATPTAAATRAQLAGRGAPRPRAQHRLRCRPTRGKAGPGAPSW